MYASNKPNNVLILNPEYALIPCVSSSTKHNTSQHRIFFEKPTLLVPLKDQFLGHQNLSSRELLHLISRQALKSETGIRFTLEKLPIAASLCFFFITLSSLLNGFLNPDSIISISLSLLCAARRSSKLKNSQLRTLWSEDGLIRKRKRGKRGGHYRDWFCFIIQEFLPCQHNYWSVQTSCT